MKTSEVRRIETNSPDLVKEDIWVPYVDKRPVKGIKNGKPVFLKWGGADPDKFNYDGLMSFGEATKIATKYQMDGVGIFPVEDLTTYDLDDAFRFEEGENTGELNPWAEFVLDSTDSYAEVSRSGNGLHVVTRGAEEKEGCKNYRVNLPSQSRKTPQIEVRSGNWLGFLTITGDRIGAGKRVKKAPNMKEALLKVPLTESTTGEKLELDDYDGDRDLDPDEVDRRLSEFGDQAGDDNSRFDAILSRYLFRKGYEFEQLESYFIENMRKVDANGIKRGASYVASTLRDAFTAVSESESGLEAAYASARRRALVTSWADMVNQWHLWYMSGPEQEWNTGAVEFPIGPGKICTLGGASGLGKTTFAVQLITELMLDENNLGRDGGPVKVLYASTEMMDRHIVEKQLTIMGGLDAKKLFKREIDEESRKLEKAMEIVSQCEMKCLSEPCNMDTLMSLKEDYVPDLIVVDYLQQFSIGSGDDQRTYIGECLKKFRRWANEDGLGFLLLSAMSRGKGGGFRETGEIEYTSDNAFVLSYEDDKLSPEDETNDFPKNRRIIRYKQRFGQDYTRFLKQDETLRFSPVDSFEPEDGPEAEPQTRAAKV